MYKARYAVIAKRLLLYLFLMRETFTPTNISASNLIVTVFKELGIFYANQANVQIFWDALSSPKVSFGVFSRIINGRESLWIL